MTEEDNRIEDPKKYVQEADGPLQKQLRKAEVQEPENLIPKRNKKRNLQNKGSRAGMRPGLKSGQRHSEGLEIDSQH